MYNMAHQFGGECLLNTNVRLSLQQRDKAHQRPMQRGVCHIAHRVSIVHMVIENQIYSRAVVSRRFVRVRTLPLSVLAPHVLQKSLIGSVCNVHVKVHRRNISGAGDRTTRPWSALNATKAASLPRSLKESYGLALRSPLSWQGGEGYVLGRPVTRLPFITWHPLCTCA